MLVKRYYWKGDYFIFDKENNAFRCFNNVNRRPGSIKYYVQLCNLYENNLYIDIVGNIFDVKREI